MVLTNNASRPGPVDEGLPEGAVGLADDLGLWWGVVVVLQELPLWAVILLLRWAKKVIAFFMTYPLSLTRVVPTAMMGLSSEEEYLSYVYLIN